MKKKCLIIALLVMVMCVVGFSGCGNSGEQDAEEFYEEETFDDEVAEDEYDPYVDGITLEEAKEGDYGTVFIKDNVLYYPLIPSYKADYTSGMTIEEVKAKRDADFNDFATQKKWYKVSPDYTQYDLPKLSSDRELVEVKAENEGTVSRINENPVYTLPCRVFYSLDVFEKKPVWSLTFDDDGVVYILKNIDEKDVEYKALDKFAMDAPIIDTDKDYNYYSDFNWDNLYREYGLKPSTVNGGSSDGLSSNLFFVKERGASVSLNYRRDGDVDSNQVTVEADVALYNMPNDINEYEKPEIHKYEYEQTDEGYSIIKMDELAAGVYATDDGYLFRKE